jgi:glycine cleavage system H protein
MNVPEELLYTKEHEWTKIEGDTAVVGITDYAQHQLGDIVYVELVEVGKEVKQMERIGTVESVKAVSDIYSPLSGTVIEVNDSLKDHPELINQDPYGKGWMVKLKIRDISETKNLMKAGDYEKYVKEESK